MTDEKNKKPIETTVTQSDDAISSRALTAEELDRIIGGVASAATTMSAVVTPL